jgi:hypothetical protein
LYFGNISIGFVAPAQNNEATLISNSILGKSPVFIDSIICFSFAEFFAKKLCLLLFQINQ